MLFEDFKSPFSEYNGPNLSEEIGDEWKCDCAEECEECSCEVKED